MIRRSRSEIIFKIVRRGGRPALVMRYRLPRETKWREVTTGCASMREAERFAAKMVRRIEDGEFSATAWTAFKERYRNEHLSGLSIKTQEAFTTASARLESLCQFSSIEEINADLLMSFAGKLRAEGKAEATIQAYRSHLLAALNWAVGLGILQKAPVMPRMRRVRSGTVSRGRPLTREEMERIALQLPGIVGSRFAQQWAWNLEALSRSGMRLGETLFLHWEPGRSHYIEQLDGERPRLVIAAEWEKAFRNRVLPLTPDFVALLRAVPQDSRKGLIFKWFLSNGLSYSVKSIGKRISAAGIAAKVVVGAKANGSLRFASAHDFRRTFALRWAPRVMPIVLKELMRHSSLDTTLKYYVGIDSDRMGDAVWSAGSTGEIGDTLDSLFCNTLEEKDHGNIKHNS